MINFGWTIAFYGSNTMKSINASSCILLNDLTHTDPMTDPNWLKVNVTALDPELKQLKKKETYTGGISSHKGRRVKAFNCEIEYNFPDDISKYLALQSLLDHQHIYLFKGTYDFDSNNWEIHPDEYAIEVVIDDELEHDHENGLKILKLEIQVKKPNPRPV